MLRNTPSATGLGITIAAMITDTKRGGKEKLQKDTITFYCRMEGYKMWIIGLIQVDITRK